MADGEKAKGYNLGVGYINATVSFDGIGNDIAKQMRKVSPKAGAETGQRIGKAMREGVEKESAKVDLASYEAHVTNVEKRIAKQSTESAEKQEAARRKVEIATAKLNEAREKYKEGSSQILAAEDKLAEAQGRLTRETKSATDAQDKLNNELSDAKKSLGDAKEAAERAADAYKQSFGKRFARKIGESIREAVSPASAAVVAGASGAVSGIAWGQGFKRGLGGQNVGGFIASTLAGMSGARVLGDIGGGFRDFVTNLDRSVPKIGAVTVGLMSLGGAGIAAVGGLLGVVNSLGSIAAVGLTLPGLIGAGVASMAVFAMAAMDAVTELEALGPMFVELQDSVSAAFWERAREPILDLANAVFPLLMTRMSEVAHEMGGIAVAVADTMNSAENIAFLDQMFVYLRDSINAAGDGVGSLVDGIMGLGTVGASYLPDLAEWFNRIAYSFEAWVAASTASGDIFRWIDTGLENLRALGGVVWHTIGIFHALGEAAKEAGAGGLVGLAEGLERANRALHSDVWQAGLVSMFSGAREAMAAIGDGFGDFARGLLDAGGVLREGMILSGESVGLVLSALGDLFAHPAVQGGLAIFFAGIHGGVQALTRDVGPLGSVLGGLLATMGTVAATLGNVVAAAVEAIGPAIVGLIDGIRPLIPLLGTALINALDFLRPAFEAVGTVVQDVLAPALEAVFGFLADNTDLILILGTAIATTVAAIAAYGAVLWVAHGGLTAFIAAKFAAATATKAFTAAQWLLNTALTMNPIGLVVAALAGLVVGFVLAYRKVEWFRNAVDAAWSGIKTAFRATIDWITNVAWPALLNGLQWVGDKFGWLWGKARDAWGWIKGAVAGVVTWFSTTVVPAFQAALDWLGTAFDFFYRNFVGPVMFLVRYAIEQVSNWFSGTAVPAFQAAINVLGAVFRWLWNWVVAPAWGGIRIIIDTVVAWFRDVAVPAFRGAVDALAAVFRWFRDVVVVPVWNAIKAVVQAVGDWFRNVLVPTIRGAVQWLMDKFTNLRNWVGAVWGAIRTTLGDGWSWIDRNVFSKFRTGLSALQAAFENVQTGISEAWNKLKAAVKAPITFVVTKVVNPFINGYNAINDAWNGSDIGTIPGFRTGGYTGKRRRDEVAGLVHGDEHVIRSESRRSIEQTSPGLLDAMNKYGASALPSFGHEGAAAHGGAAAGRGGPGSYLWGPLQNSIYASGVAHVSGSAPGYNLAAAARAWNNIGNLRVRYGRGQNQINVGSGAPAGTWGYAWTNGRIQLNPNIPQGMKTGTAAHEIGHVLGLDHAGTNSIMHPMMRGPLWPSAYDRASIQRIYGGSGKGNPPEGGGGGGVGILDWLKGKILDPFTSAIGSFKAKFADNDFVQMGLGLAGKAKDGLVSYMVDKLNPFSGLLESVKDTVGGFLNRIRGNAAMSPFAGGQMWDAPVGTVHKLSPGVSSIYNGTGGDEFFERVTPGGNGPLVQNLYAFDADEAMMKLDRARMKREALHAV